MHKKMFIREVVGIVKDNCYSPGCEQLNCHACTVSRVKDLFEKRNVVVPMLRIGDKVKTHNDIFDRNIELTVVLVKSEISADGTMIAYDGELIEDGQVVVRECFDESEIGTKVYV